MKADYEFVSDLQACLEPSGAETHPSPNIQGRAVFADSRMKVLLLPFRAGQVLAEHTTPHAAIMHVLQGRGEITLGEDRHDVGAGAWMKMTPGLPHSIRATSDLLLLLQVFLDPRDTLPTPARA